MIFKEFLRHFKFYFFVGLITFGLFGIVNQINQEIYNFEHQDVQDIIAFGRYKFLLTVVPLISFLLAVFSSLLDVFVLRKILHKRSLGFIVLIGIIIQSISILLVVNLMFNFVQRLFKSIGETNFEQIDLFQMSPAIIYMVFTVLLSILLIEIDRKLGVGNFWKILTGRFYNPKEEKRIFIFIDLKDSTPIAEKLGHIKFSAFLQDCFYDLAIVSKHLAAVYQYVGDEVVLSWNYKDGFKNENFIKAFFAFDKVLSNRKEYYMEKYGITPYFKAGVNFGPVVVAEVGSNKREICYHGDTLNTASRIQDMCNELESKILIPQKLYEKVKDSKEFNFEDVGCVELKGKQKEIRLFNVTRA